MRATLSLIAFSYYVPLSTMIAPMLVSAAEEAVTAGNNSNSNNNSNHSSRNQGRQRDSETGPGTRVLYIKPFLSMIAISKCVLVVVSFFFGDGKVCVLLIDFLYSSAGNCHYSPLGFEMFCLLKRHPLPSGVHSSSCPSSSAPCW